MTRFKEDLHGPCRAAAGFLIFGTFRLCGACRSLRRPDELPSRAKNRPNQMKQANEGKLHWLSLSRTWGQEVNGIVLLLVGDIPISSESSVVHSSISSQRFTGPIFECAHRGRICVRVFIKMSVHAC